LNSTYNRDEHLQRRRKLFPNVSDADWNDWKWMLKNRIETIEDLQKHIKLTNQEIEGIKDCSKA
jgi:lysine 2,3-aminomutase